MVNYVIFSFVDFCYHHKNKLDLPISHITKWQAVCNTLHPNIHIRVELDSPAKYELYFLIIMIVLRVFGLRSFLLLLSLAYEKIDFLKYNPSVSALLKKNDS